ncbi:hypothetical protein EVB94_222 [Rhizobium phage RHph_TM40]|uniref:Uncharacterized protein n=2 Tax=Cuauhnahuacvirus TaxID=3044696 RepID=A0A7S5UVZ6_9CAUD|nr:putative resolvase RusA-like protein [Rhizobium phage RHph_TM30]YP_010671371.1 hypothetical protein PQC17_gp222 [Rhizobium phage RHph_Y65]QIG71693.1 hypothetical protein EVB94_222 [Rhizobium phage RHph_TM40]QIG72056.1 hypothetical protein EVB95_222 [Rhizobium phage RHph_TM2_3B]QIG72418.1 hypothetical protein EVB96_222 [Rhizobium phage RHph_TM3_3_6]QIG77809.1 hypothetical protein EVB64_222 [Rhizobium phage RHph_TM61]QIG71329.1 putative resolvase RusA-like protein [Rhizobium phage RHph_TM30]
MNVEILWNKHLSEWIEFEGMIRFKTRSIPSENDLYKPNYRSKHMYKNPEIGGYQDDFIELGKKTDLIKVRDYVDKWSEIRVEFHFYLRSNRKIWGLDVTNMVKATEDALKDITKIDDSKHKSVTSEKYESEDEYESVKVVYRMKLKDEA